MGRWTTGKPIELDEIATLFATKVHSRMPEFLRGRCPSDMQIHWVWTSFVTNFLKEISCLAVLADLQSRALKYATPLETILNQDFKVFMELDDDTGPMDGCYIQADTVRQNIVRAGMAEKGFERRAKEHRRASQLKDLGSQDRMLYQSYPHESVSDELAPNKKGTFGQLELRVALGMRKADKSKILQLFQWTEADKANIGKLKYGDNAAGTLVDRQYKHFCYMCELLFAVSVDPGKNLTSNPTCEWQLQGLFSKGKA
jgi:hypothetical protein